MRLNLLSVSVGLPAPLGVWQGETVASGIRKTPVPRASIRAGLTNLEGDGQADLSVHGGVDKAVYAYPVDHWGWWRDEAGFAAQAASFGENLTLQGVHEAAVRIGDRFSWGPDVVLEISQPRAPCFKFGLMTGRDDLPSRMTVSGRTGWYFRVVTQGVAPTRGRLDLMSTDSDMPTVREAFFAMFQPRVRSDVLERVLAAPALAESWRTGLTKRLSAAQQG
jgi:MOSC domain-containing protein YiiM